MSGQTLFLTSSELSEHCYLDKRHHSISHKKNLHDSWSLLQNKPLQGSGCLVLSLLCYNVLLNSSNGRVKAQGQTGLLIVSLHCIPPSMYTNKHPNPLHPKHMLTKTLMIDYISTFLYKHPSVRQKTNTPSRSLSLYPSLGKRRGIHVQMGSDVEFKSSLKSVNTGYERHP